MVRRALVVEAGGEQFLFYYDVEVPQMLHITLRHGTTPEDAIRTFLDGVTVWNDAQMRFETTSSTQVSIGPGMLTIIP